jgi:hypothetical protein
MSKRKHWSSFGSKAKHTVGLVSNTEMMGAFGTMWTVEYAAMLRQSLEDPVPTMACHRWYEGLTNDKCRRL